MVSNLEFKNVLFQLIKCRYLKHSLQRLLRKLHYAKKKGMSGSSLYEAILQPIIAEEKVLSIGLKNMLW